MVEAFNVDLRRMEDGKRQPSALQIFYSRAEATFRKVLSEVAVDRRLRTRSAYALVCVPVAVDARVRDVSVSAADHVVG